MGSRSEDIIPRTGGTERTVGLPAERANARGSTPHILPPNRKKEHKAKGQVGPQISFQSEKAARGQSLRIEVVVQGGGTDKSGPKDGSSLVTHWAGDAGLRRQA